MTRYWKASNGRITAFRASDDREYQSAWWNTEVVEGVARVVGGIVFSKKPATGDKCEAIEISAAEYEALMARQRTRVIAAGGTPSRPVEGWPKGAVPQDCWVRRGGVTWRGWVPATDPRYHSGEWRFLLSTQ
jgi:hypothetical protein